MFRRIFDRHKLEISIISCGDIGEEIGMKLISTLKKHGATVRSLLVTSEIDLKPKYKVFDQVVSIDDKHDGFAKRLDDGIDAAEAHKEEIDQAISKIMPSEENGLMFVATGSGATGLGSSLVIIELLYRKYRKIPPILTLLPEEFENSRVQYNTSVFLYRVTFREGNYGNGVLFLDNKPNHEEMEKPVSQIAKSRINELPTAFADLLYASFEKSLNEEFDATENDLFEVIHTPGISVFVAEDIGSNGGSEIDSGRIEDVISDNVISATSLSKDQVFDAKNAFIAIFYEEEKDGGLSFQKIVEARKLYSKFRETNPFVKIISAQKGKPKIRAILSGLPLPNRVLQIMRLARENRKRIMVQEYQLNNEVIPLDIDKIHELEAKLLE